MFETAVNTQIAERSAGAAPMTVPLPLQPVTSSRPTRQRDEAGSPAALVREGEYWTISFAGEEVRVCHTKGLGYLAELLAQPGREVDVVTLACAVSPERVSDVDAADAGLLSSADADLGPILDARAKRAYRQRLEELREQIDRSSMLGDSQRAVQARLEWEAIVDQLGRATGLQGRDRRAGSAAERARLNVTRAIKVAITRIAASAPTLGEHLSACVHTGRLCVYRPNGSLPISWNVRARTTPRRLSLCPPAPAMRSTRPTSAGVCYRVLGEWAVGAGARTGPRCASR